MNCRVFLLFSVLSLLLISKSEAQNTWLAKSDFAGSPVQGAVGFSIGTKGYIGTGLYGSQFRGELWEWDQVNDVWSQKAQFNSSWGNVMGLAVGLSIGNKGYVITGSQGSPLPTKCVTEYDPSTNTWTSKVDFPGTYRYNACGFTIAGKGYVGCGFNSVNYLSDFWEYNPTNDSWVQKASLPVARSAAGAFSVNGKGYVSCGVNSSGGLVDTWEYDPTLNVWTVKSNCGYTGVMERAYGYSIGSRGYILAGRDFNNNLQFWEFDPNANVWVQRAIYTGTFMFGSTGFTIGNKCYSGTGVKSGNYYVDFWEYTPLVVSIENVSFDETIKCYPNPTDKEIVVEIPIPHCILYINDNAGRLIYSQICEQGEERICLEGFEKGAYQLLILGENGKYCTQLIVN